jgi:prepilin-type N-terminal cleavage/methylation domain-containing protein
MFRKKEKGFTLIELMIVIAIIGILAAIAIPQFAAYRIRGFNATAQSDLRNMATAQEAYFADKQAYTNALVDLTAYGYTQSNNVSAVLNSANSFTYNMKASHGSGDRTWVLTGPGGIIN